jgi:hypothetical protein
MQNSAIFASPPFSEVGLPLYGVLRSSLPAKYASASTKNPPNGGWAEIAADSITSSSKFEGKRGERERERAAGIVTTDV